MTVNIIVTTCDFLKCTQLCVRSIIENTRVPYKLIFVDDLSSDGTVGWLKTVPGSTVLENRGTRRHGWWAGNNIGLGAGAADYYALVDRDMIVSPGWLGKCVQLLEAETSLGAVSPVCNAGAGEQGIPQGAESHVWPEKWPGKQWVPQPLSIGEVNGFGKYVEDGNRGKWMYNAPLYFQCVVLPHKTIKRVGLFDERFVWADGDFDYCYRVLKAELFTAVRLDTYVHHQARFASEAVPPNHYGAASLTYWYDKYPQTKPQKPENRDWNSFLPHKNELLTI